MNLKGLLMIVITVVIVLAMVPVLWESIYTTSLSCIATNTTPLATDCKGNECGHADIYNIEDEQNYTVLNLPNPTWTTTEYHPLDVDSELIFIENTTSSIETTLTKNVNYTINYNTGLINFTHVITGGDITAWLNYDYIVIVSNSCCAVCVSGVTSTLLLLVPFIFVGLFILGGILVAKAKGYI